jgi:hypothetical protein
MAFNSAASLVLEPPRVSRASARSSTMAFIDSVEGRRFTKSMSSGPKRVSALMWIVEF